MSIEADFIRENGKKIKAVISMQDFETLKHYRELEDKYDHELIQSMKDEPTISWEEMEKRLGWDKL